MSIMTSRTADATERNVMYRDCFIKKNRTFAFEIILTASFVTTKVKIISEI